MTMPSNLKAICVALAGAVLLVACGDSGGEGDDSPGAGPSASDELIVSAANYDLAAGEEERFIAGLLTPDQNFVSYGTVDMKFFYLGTEQGEGTAEPGPETTGEFLRIEGDSPSDVPTSGPASEGRGVYGAQVTFDEAGYWAVEVTADVEGEGELTGNSVFEVREKHIYPAPGDEAPMVENHLAGTKEVAPAAVDSRAQGGEPIPDPELHDITVADALRKGRPILLVVSTPVYCVSRFCGPVTDMIAGLEKDHGDKAEFIHIEMWRDFEKREVNKAAADWMYRKGDLTEPWIWLIGADGKIQARWDNVATPEEIEPLLEKL